MKFFSIRLEYTGETIGCELTRRAAIEWAEARGYDKREFEIIVDDVPVTADTVRRLLGNLGGYAK